MIKIAWIGLGVMGFPMAGHLVNRGGFKLTVYNRTSAKAEKWQTQFGGMIATTPAAAVRDADFVFACVGNDDDLRAVTIGIDGAFSAMKPGAVFIDHTTASADVARELHAVAATLKLGFVDAPVSGGQMGAENGALTVMCGGDITDYEKAEPLIAHFAKMCKRLGPPGAGQLAKMCNQIAIAGLVQGLAESVQFGMQAGLDMEAVVEVSPKALPVLGKWKIDTKL
jgi:3-hydroxyisobutyrate dehydrogenase